MWSIVLQCKVDFCVGKPSTNISWILACAAQIRGQN